MININWIKRRYVLISIFVIFLLVLCYFNSKTKSVLKDNDNNLKEQISIYKEKSSKDIVQYSKLYIAENKEIITKYFENRVGINKGQGILIGTNKKELENGYYDICIRTGENALEVYIAKLWKDPKGTGMYDEYYLKEVARCILDICKKEYTEEAISKLEKYILDEYLKSKEDKPIMKNTNIDNIQIATEVKEGVLLMSIH